MTKIRLEKSKCALCRKENEYPVLCSTNTLFGSPDLDFRPPDMMRSTMDTWIQECPECGYVSRKVSDPSSVTRQLLQSESYLTCDGIEFISPLARSFYRFYLINLEDKNTEEAFYALLHAAWACDDRLDDENAVRCRNLAIPLSARLIDAGHWNRDRLMLIKADMMRRTRQFQALIDQYASVQFEDPRLNRILAFQIRKAKIGDARCFQLKKIPGI